MNRRILLVEVSPYCQYSKLGGWGLKHHENFMTKAHKAEINKLKKELAELTAGLVDTGRCPRCGTCYCWKRFGSMETGKYEPDNSQTFCVDGGKCFGHMAMYSVVSRDDVREEYEAHKVEIIDSYCPECEFDIDVNAMIFDIDAASAKQPAQWRRDADNWERQMKRELQRQYMDELEHS